MQKLQEFYSPIWCTSCKRYLNFLDIKLSNSKLVHKLCEKAVINKI